MWTKVNISTSRLSANVQVLPDYFLRKIHQEFLTTFFSLEIVWGVIRKMVLRF